MNHTGKHNHSVTSAAEKKRQRHINLTRLLLLWKKDQNKTLIVFLYDNTASPNADFLEVRGYSSDNNAKVECDTITASQKSTKTISIEQYKPLLLPSNEYWLQR